MTRLKLLLLAAALPATALLATAADWPHFRGPTGFGTSDEKNLPATWSARSGIVWKTALPGPGTSSPIVVGKKIFLTSYSGYAVDQRDPGSIKDLKRHLICLDRDKGKVLWSRE